MKKLPFVFAGLISTAIPMSAQALTQYEIWVRWVNASFATYGNGSFMDYNSYAVWTGLGPVEAGNSFNALDSNQDGLLSKSEYMAGTDT